jgi:hypothetical protein
MGVVPNVSVDGRAIICLRAAELATSPANHEWGVGSSSVDPGPVLLCDLRFTALLGLDDASTGRAIILLVLLA